MTRNEANDAAQYLLGLFPSLSAEQIVEWAREFEKHNDRDVRAACRYHHSLSTDGFVKPKGLRDAIKEELHRTNHGTRMAIAAKEAQAVRDAAERERVKSSGSYSSVDRVLAGLTDEDLAELKSVVMEAKPNLAKFLKSSDPRKGKILRALMAQHYQNCTAHR